MTFPSLKLPSLKDYQHTEEIDFVTYQEAPRKEKIGIIASKIIYDLTFAASREEDYKPILRWQFAPFETRSHSLPYAGSSHSALLVDLNGWKAILDLASGAAFEGNSVVPHKTTELHIDGKLLDSLTQENLHDLMEEEAPQTKSEDEREQPALFGATLGLVPIGILQIPKRENQYAHFARNHEAVEKTILLTSFLSSDKQLESISLIHEPLPNDLLLKLLPPMEVHSSLKKIDLSGNKLGEEKVSIFLEALSKRSLSLNLSLRENGLKTTEGISHFFTSRPFVQLDLSDNPFCDWGVTPLLQELLGRRDDAPLTVLKLNNAGLTDCVVTLLSELIVSEVPLSQLCLNGNRIDNDGAIELVIATPRSKNLKTLELSRNLVDDVGATQIRELLSSNDSLTLRHLSLESDLIRDEENRSFIKQICQAPSDEIKLIAYEDDHPTISFPAALCSFVWERLKAQVVSSAIGFHSPFSTHQNSLDSNRRRLNSSSSHSFLGVSQLIQNWSRSREERPVALLEAPEKTSSDEEPEIELD